METGIISFNVKVGRWWNIQIHLNLCLILVDSGGHRNVPRPRWSSWPRTNCSSSNEASCSFILPGNECPRWRGNLLKFPGHPKILKICRHLCVKVPTKTPVLLWCDGEAPGAWTQTSKKNSKTDRTSASAPKTPPEDSKHSSPMSPTLNNRKIAKELRNKATAFLAKWQNSLRWNVVLCLGSWEKNLHCWNTLWTVWIWRMAILAPSPGPGLGLRPAYWNDDVSIVQQKTGRENTVDPVHANAYLGKRSQNNYWTGRFHNFYLLELF